jgi:hypothetical protein
MNSTTEFLAGDEVEINEGPLNGIKGILTDITTLSRAVVSVSLLNRSVAVVIDSGWISLIQRRDAVIIGQIRAAVEPITAEVIFLLAAHPNEIYELHPIKFELLVARLLEDAGYKVRVTPATRDGGRDILAVLKIPFGEVLTIVDCKRFASHRKIGPELVQRLLWVSDNYDKASNAMLVTTSSFTSGARMIEQEYRWRLRLKEYGDIHEWLCQFGKWRPDGAGSLWLPDEPQIATPKAKTTLTTDH